jgi:hypothetical protein
MATPLSVIPETMSVPEVSKKHTDVHAILFDPAIVADAYVRLVPVPLELVALSNAIESAYAGVQAKKEIMRRAKTITCFRIG